MASSRILLLALAGFLVPGTAHAAIPRAWNPGGQLGLDVFATSDLFAGGETRDADRAVRVWARPELTIRLRHGLRVRPWASWIAERYDRFPERDVDRFEFGTDVRRGRLGLSAFAGFTRDELDFPTATSEVRLDRSHWGLEGRFEPNPGWMARVVLTRDIEDFVPTADERDDRRWSLRSGIERRFTPRLRVMGSHLYRRTESVTDLYSYAQNALRFEGLYQVGPRARTRGLVEFGLRQYRTGQSFAANFARSDDRWRAEAAVGGTIAGPLGAEVLASWSQRMSTRNVKNYAVRTIGFGLTLSR